MKQKEIRQECVTRIADVQSLYMNVVCDTLPDFITDLLTDLMHYAKAKGIGFDNQLRIARNHFQSEQGD